MGSDGGDNSPDMLGMSNLGDNLLGGGPGGGTGGGSGTEIVGDWFLGLDILGGGPGSGAGDGGGGGVVPDYSGRIVAEATVEADLDVTKLQPVAGNPSGQASVSGELTLPVAALTPQDIVGGTPVDTVPWTAGSSFDVAIQEFTPRAIDSWRWSGSGRAHTHSAASITVTVEIRDAGSGLWSTVHSVVTSGTLQLADIVASFPLVFVDAVRLAADPAQNVAFHDVTGSMLLPSDTSVTGRLGLVISDLNGTADGGTNVAADLGQHLLQGGQADGESVVAGELILQVAMDAADSVGDSVVEADVGVTTWLEPGPVDGSSTVVAQIGLILDDLTGTAAGDTSVAGDFEIHLLPPQPIITGVEEIFASLSLEGEFAAFSMGSASVAADPEVIYDLVATDSVGETGVDANLTRWAELSGGSVAGEAVVDASMTVYMLSGGLIEGESDVDARLYYAEGYVPLYARPSGASEVIAHITMRAFLHHMPIQGSAEVDATLYYLEELEGQVQSQADVSGGFEIYTIPPDPIVGEGEVEANLTGKFGWVGDIICGATVELTVPILMETHFLPEEVHGETTVTTGFFYVEPHDLLVERIQTSTSFPRVRLVRDVGLSATTSTVNDRYLALREDGEPIITNPRSDEARQWGGVNNTGDPHAMSGATLLPAPALGMPVVIGIYTVDIVRGESVVKVTQLIVNMGGQSNGQNRGTADLLVIKKSFISAVVDGAETSFDRVDFWPRGLLEPFPSDGWTGVGEFKENGVNVHPFWGVSYQDKQYTGRSSEIKTWNRDPGYFVPTFNEFHGVALVATTSTEDDFYKKNLTFQDTRYSPESAWVVPDYVDSHGNKIVHRRCGAWFTSTLDGSNSVDLFVELKNALYGYIVGESTITAEFIVLRYRTMTVEGNVARVGDRMLVRTGIVSKTDQPHVPLAQRRNVELDDQRQPVPLFT